MIVLTSELPFITPVGPGIEISVIPQTEHIGIALLASTHDVGKGRIICGHREASIIFALSWKFDVAGSAYTREKRQGKIDLKDEQVPAYLTNLYTPRTSSLFSWSGETSLTLNLEGFTVGGTYRRVNPDYRSMGVNYINDDVENITLNTSFSLWKNKLSISGRYGIQRNQREGFLINSSLYLSYQVGGNQSVSLNLSVIQSEMQGSDFIESRGNLGYNVSF